MAEGLRWSKPWTVLFVRTRIVEAPWLKLGGQGWGGVGLKALTCNDRVLKD